MKLRKTVTEIDPNTGKPVTYTPSKIPTGNNVVGPIRVVKDIISIAKRKGH